MKKEYAEVQHVRHTPIMYSYPVKIVSKTLDKQAELCYNESVQEKTLRKFSTYKPESGDVASICTLFLLLDSILTYFLWKVKEKFSFHNAFE